MSEVRSPNPRKTQVVAGFAFLGFAVVLLAIEAMAVRGQLDFARHVMGLSDQYVYVVPLALEGGTLVTAMLALWATLTGDPTFMHRVWTWVFLAGAAAANWLGALAAGRSPIAAVYLAAFCVAALRMWHAILHRIRRSELRVAGATESPLPRFRLLRWFVAPRETFTAWKVAVRADVASPAEALALARREIQALTPASSPAAGTDVDLTSLTKKAAIEHAAGVLGTFAVNPIRDYLAERGITTDRSNTSKVLRDLQDERRREVVRAVPVEA